jgi:uncharacterized protein YecE (DUF72 family)
MAKDWCKKTPYSFQITAKFPKVITHDKRLKGCRKRTRIVLLFLVNLKDKILALLIQLSPSIKIVEGMNRLRYHT